MVSQWNKVFKNGPSEICGRQSLKNLKEYDGFKFGLGELWGLHNIKMQFWWSLTPNFGCYLNQFKNIWKGSFLAIAINDTHREKLYFTQFSTKMATWLLLVFFMCLHNQLSSTHSIITY